MHPVRKVTDLDQLSLHTRVLNRQEELYSIQIKESGAEKNRWINCKLKNMAFLII